MPAEDENQFGSFFSLNESFDRGKRIVGSSQYNYAVEISSITASGVGCTAIIFAMKRIAKARLQLENRSCLGC